MAKLEKERLKYLKEKEEWREDASKKIPLLVEEGFELISESRHTRWETFVAKHVYGRYHGDDIKTALNIMKSLNTETNIQELASNFFKNDYPHEYENSVRNIVLKFHQRGQEFYKATETNNKNFKRK